MNREIGDSSPLLVKRLRNVKGMKKSNKPEFVHYKDEGCELAPSCLECPFDRCILEEGGIASVERKERNQEIKELANQGITVPELAERYGVSLRTIQRILRRK